MDIAEAYKNYTPLTPTTVFPENAEAEDLPSHINDIFHHLISAHLNVVRLKMNYLSARLGPEKFLFQVVCPLMVRLGSDWAAGRIRIWQEHLATSCLQSYLQSMILASQPIKSNHRILTCTIDEEQHLGGSLLVTALLRSLGFNAEILGQGLPFEELNLAATQLKPQLICVSMINTEASEDIFRKIINHSWSQPVVLGGSATQKFKMDFSAMTNEKVFRSPDYNFPVQLFSIMSS